MMGIVRGLCTVLLCLASMQAQQSSPAVQLKTRGPDDHVVAFDVVALDRTGVPLHGLGPGDFIVRDDKRPVPISSLKIAGTADSQAQLVFVLDAVNSSLAELTLSETALEAFLKAQGARLEQTATILIASDTDAAKTGAGAKNTTTLHQRQLFVHRIPGSTDTAALISALHDYRPGLHRILETQDATGQGERVRLSLEALSFIANAETAVPDTKLVIWMSPGWPFLAESNAHSSERLFDSIIYFSDLLRAARILLYAVNPQGVTAQDPSADGPSLVSAQARAPLGTSHSIHPSGTTGSDFYTQFLKGAASAKQANPTALALQVLAVQSGGLVLQQNNDIQAMLRRCVADSSALYTLSFDPAGSGDSPAYHTLSVELARGGQPVRTRTGFYSR